MNIIDQSGNRAFPQTALETRLLVEEVSKGPEGRVITYGEMEKLIGRPVKTGTRGYGYLQSAKRILLRDHDILLDAEPKVGIRICTNSEKLTVAGRDIRKAGRAVKRSGQKLRSVAYDQLTDAEKREWNARSSLAGALNLLAAPAAAKKVAEAVNGSQLPSAKVLELFKS